MRYLLLVLIVLFGSMPDAEAAYRKREVRHAIIVGYGDKSAEMEVLDCKYGEFQSLWVRFPAACGVN